MAENFYTIITKTGLAKIANAQLTSEKVNFSHIVIGDSNGVYYNPQSNATTLVNEVWRGGIGSISVDENNPNWIVVETVVPATVGGFTVRELGLLDASGDMIAIGKYPQTYKPVLADGSSKDLYIRMIIEVANTSVVTLKVDPTVVIASRKYVDDKVASTSGIVGDAVNSINNGTITITPLETTDKTLAGAINEVNAKANTNKDSLTTHLAEDATDVHKIKNIQGLQLALDSKINNSDKGQPNGIAILDENGNIPSALLNNGTKVASGTYVGDGVENRVIEFGFNYKEVTIFSGNDHWANIIKDSGAGFFVNITGATIKFNEVGRIAEFTETGIRVGSTYSVFNGNARTYRWVAIG